MTTPSLISAAISALLQALLIGGVPFFTFFIYHRRRHQRTFHEIAQLAGLQLGQVRYVAYGLACATAGAIILLSRSPPLGPLTRLGSPLHHFVGLGLGAPTITMALFYGAVQTGFTEELLFRGLIAGILSRRLSLLWANLLQALVFLLPHLALLLIAPELWGMLPVIFAGALLFGWMRIKSGSIVGSWLIHASGNVTMALMACRSSPGSIVA